MRETLYFDHWSQMPDECWLWENFTPREIACRGTGKLLVHREAMDTLQALRDLLGKPMFVNSAYRSPEHNEAVGGAPASKHMQGIAFDVSMRNHDPREYDHFARQAGFTRVHYYGPAMNFTHADIAAPNGWGARFNG
jgi:zinc D-Ala-D-Ala carboxypeptidase